MKANILIVDDRMENLLALQAILEPLDCHLLTAHSGLEALKHLLTNEVALILMDVQMPGLDGFETASLIKEREKNRHIPIIFITAISKEQHYVFKGYSAGAVDYISKPFDPDILRSKVAVFIDLWAKGEQIKQQAELVRRNEQLEQERQMAQLERDLERRHLAELAESEARLSHFKSTLDSTLDCVLIFDAETLAYSYANQGALEHLGYEYEEMLGMTSVCIKPDLTEPEFREMLQPLRVGTHSSLRFETVHRRKNDTQVPVEVFLQFIQPSGEEGRFVSIVRDISERKRAEEALILAKEAAERERINAERANRAKSDFLAGISHELRTPLNAIIGFSKLLLNPLVGALNEDQQAYTQDVVQSAEHLLQLINDILDLSKIEAGKMVLELGTFLVPELLEQSLTVVREPARAKNITLRVECAPALSGLPPLVVDTRKIRQVMYNLLSNAVKFTPEGGSIAVSADLYPTKSAEALGEIADEAFEDSPHFIVRVRDTGIGIAPIHQARIFNTFEQVDSSYTRQQQGTGLGLALTRRIIELHGGRIWVESTEGQGSTFSFILPLRASIDEAMPADTVASEIKSPTDSPINVLAGSGSSLADTSNTSEESPYLSKSGNRSRRTRTPRNEKAPTT